jgi:hypothetical protein
MTSTSFAAVLFICISGASVANASGSNSPNPTSGVTCSTCAEVRTLNERVPAGGTVQVKYLLTQPRPITSGGYGFSMYDFAVDGIALTSPLGDTAGAGVVSNGKLTLFVVSPNSDFGTNLDYPFITLTMDVPSSTPTGSIFPLTLDAGSVETPTGPLTFADAKPGALTIGGTVSIRGVFPGGGTYPAGTVITVQGKGFQPGTRLTTKMKTSSAIFVSPTELRFTLNETAKMDTQPITAQNPDGSQVTFYSYLRGTPVAVPSRPVLQATEPVFQAIAHSLATVSAASCGVNEYLAIAIQNPNRAPVSVGFLNQTTGSFSSLVLPPAGRMMDEVGTLTGSAALSGSDVLIIGATAPVQVLGLCADDSAFTVVPFLPAF